MLVCSDFVGAVSVVQFWDDKVSPPPLLETIICT